MTEVVPAPPPLQVPPIEAGRPGVVISRWGERTGRTSLWREWGAVEAARVLLEFRRGKDAGARLIAELGQPFWEVAGQTGSKLTWQHTVAWATSWTLTQAARDHLGAQVISVIARRAFNETGMRDVASWDGAAIILKDSAALSDEEASAVEEVSQTRDGVKIKVRDFASDRALLAKIAGVVVEKAQVTGAGGGPIEYKVIDYSNAPDASS